MSRLRAILAATVAVTGCTVGYGAAQPDSGSFYFRSGNPVVAAGHGWTAAGVDGPVPAPGSCHLRKAANGEPLPDPRCTPGAVDPAVTARTLRTTVCRPGGYTASVRPPLKITQAAKRKIMAAYGIPWSHAGKYELDHLVPLEAGGSSDIRNLYPEPNIFLGPHHRSAFAHNDKDELEARARAALCSGSAGLATVQKAFAKDWTLLQVAL